MKTATSEHGLESLIVRAMARRTDLVSPPHSPIDTSVPVATGTGSLLGDTNDRHESPANKDADE